MAGIPKPPPNAVEVTSEGGFRQSDSVCFRWDTKINGELHKIYLVRDSANTNFIVPWGLIKLSEPSWRYMRSKHGIDTERYVTYKLGDLEQG